MAGLALSTAGFPARSPAAAEGPASLVAAQARARVAGFGSDAVVFTLNGATGSGFGPF